MEQHITDSDDLNKAQSHSLRRRVIYLIAAIALASPIFVYSWLAYKVADEARVRLILDRYKAMAVLSAGTLDEQCRTATTLMRNLAVQVRIGEENSNAERIRVHRLLKEAVDLVPDLMFAAAYGRDGEFIDLYPADAPGPGRSHSRDWFDVERKPLSGYTGSVIHLPKGHGGDLFEIAVPVQRNRKVAGYLVAYYSVGRMDEWLRQIHLLETSAYVFDRQGEVVLGFPARGSIIRREDFNSVKYLALREAPSFQYRSDELLAGIAKAPLLDFTVVIVQPRVTGVAAMDILGRRVVLLAIPIIAGALVVAWILAGLHNNQEVMNHVLAAKNRDLSSAAHMKSEFLANASHELRTPLTSVKLIVSSMLNGDSPADNEPVLEPLKIADRQLDRVLARVRNLLAFSRLDSPCVKLNKELCDVTDLVSEALERLSAVVAPRQVNTRFPAEPLFVECDQEQVTIVLVNLIENALHYSPPETPIDLEGKPGNNVISVTVRDYGPGIPENERELVFERYYRQAGAKPNGTGIGLAICSRIIELHSGSIHLTCPGDGGTQMEVRIPQSNVSLEAAI